MPFSPLVALIGVIFVISVCMLVMLAFEEKFDENEASKFEQDVAYQTMLQELRQMQGKPVLKRKQRIRAEEVTPLYKPGF